MYFAEEKEANENDPVLNLIEQLHRRDTLIAHKQSNGSYLFDIYLQGDKETVFFDV
jgi:protocatechuate 3,4-dioxygenase alpha subunit